jgi:hypothetical protein
MIKIGFATLAAGALTTAILGLATPAQAAPTGPANAQDLITQLQERGVRVIINREGPVGPLDQASVSSVRIDNHHHVAYVNVR